MKRTKEKNSFTVVKRNNEEVLEPAKKPPSKVQRRQSHRRSVDGKSALTIRRSFTSLLFSHLPALSFYKQ